MLQGSLFVDLTIIASIPVDEISDFSYGDIALSVLVNNFEATASVGSEAFSLSFPINLPISNGETLNFNLTDANFLMDLFIKTQAPIDLAQLFSHDQGKAPDSFLNHSGTFSANLPMTVGMADVNVGVVLIVEEPNIFEPNPVIDHAIDLCEISAAVTDLFDQLKTQIIAVVEAPFQDSAVVTINIEKITDPLRTKVENALAEFSNGLNVTLSSADCARRLGVVGDTVQAAKSLAQTIQDSLQHVNDALNSVGIVLSASAVPYFDKETFSIGVSVELRATFDQNASETLTLFTDYVAYSTDPSSDTSTAKLGLGNSGDAPVFNLEDLSSMMSLAAGLDITFGIDINLAEINNGISDSSHSLGKALSKGCALFIDTWGAFGEITVAPTDVGTTLFGNEIHIRDSHFALAAELRSRGRFFASIDNMIAGGSEFDPSPLIPDFTVPFSAELMIDISVNNETSISPIISVESENLVVNGLVFDFDLDITTFLNSDIMGENTFLSVLENATSFLQELASLKPEFYVSDVPSALDGFFSVVTQLGDLGEELVMYIETVDEGVFEEMLYVFMFCEFLLYAKVSCSAKLDSCRNKVCCQTFNPLLKRRVHRSTRDVYQLLVHQA